MSLSRNLLAGLFNSIWTALLGLAVVPLYLKYLGMEAYGLIGFFVTLQALLQLLDMGLAPTINREVARHSADGNLIHAGKLLHSLAVVYWSIAAVIALLLLFLSPWIANNWLQSKQLSPLVLTHAIMLMGLVIACRWPIGLYQGALIGAQRLAVSSGVSIVMVTLGNLGAVAVLAFWSPTIEAFFIWQAGVNLIYAVTMRQAAWRVIGRAETLRFDLEQLKTVWRFSAGMSGIALLGLLLNQLDKVILSKILTLDAFAHYMLATVIVNGLFVVVSPTFNAIYPRFTALVIAKDMERLSDLYRLGSRVIASFLFPATMILVVFAEDLVRLWTGNLDVAVNVSPIISFLAIGTALHGVMYFPYALQLAHGMTRIPLIICTSLVVLMLPLITLLAFKYGALGGAIAWFVLNVLYVLFGTWLTHRHLLKGLLMRWLVCDIGVPLVWSILLGTIGYFLVQKAEYPAYQKLILGSFLALGASLLSISMSQKLRILISSKSKAKFFLRKN